MWGELLERMVRDECGLEVVEYSIIAGLIVAGVIASIAAIGSWVAGVFTSLRNMMGV